MGLPRGLLSGINEPDLSCRVGLFTTKNKTSYSRCFLNTNTSGFFAERPHPFIWYKFRRNEDLTVPLTLPHLLLMLCLTYQVLFIFTTFPSCHFVDTLYTFYWLL